MSFYYNYVILFVRINISGDLALKKKRENEKRSYILTKETIGVTLLLFSALVFIMLLSYDAIFLGFGKAICTFMYGTFGYGSYLVVASLAYLGEWLAFEKSFTVKPRIALCLALTGFCLFLLFHAVTTRNFDLQNYGTYLSQCYSNAANGYSGYTFGGVISGLLVYPVAKVMTFVGAYVIFSILSVLFGVMSFLAIRNALLTKTVEKVTDTHVAESEKPVDENDIQSEERSSGDRLYRVNENHEIVTNVGTPRRQQEIAPAEDVQEEDEDKYSSKNLGRKILFENGEFAAESYRRNMIYNDSSYFNHPVHNDGDYLQSFSNGSEPSYSEPQSTGSYTESYSQEVENGQSATSAPSYVYGDTPVSDLGGHATEQAANAGYSSYTVDSAAEPLNYEDVEDVTDNGVEEETFTPQNDAPVSEIREYEQPAQQPVQPEQTFRQSEQSLEQPRRDFEQPSRFERMETPSEDSFRQAEVRSEEIIQPDESGLRDGIAENNERSAGVEEPQERTRSVNLFDIFNSSNKNLTQNLGSAEPDISVLNDSGRDRSREQLFDDTEGEDGGLFGDEEPLSDRSTEDSAPIDGERVRTVGFGSVPAETNEVHAERVEIQKPAEVKPVPVVKPVEVKPAEVVEEKPAEPEKPKHVWKKYVRPSLDLLFDYPENNNVNTGEIEENKQIICETLANFRIDSRIANVVVGPAITRYDVIIEDRTNIKNALKYRDAIAMALMKENVNAYLNYAKGAISIEVPNAKRTTVGLKSMLASSEFINAKPNSLTFTLGKNVDGQVVCPDITKMPHLLVAGTTGSGKSICLSTLIVSLLYKYGPEELRFILVDPKQVEFISYDKLPHLMINEIIYDIDKAMKALNWAIKEMERRYALFKTMTESGIATKNLTEYNEHLPEGEEKLPKIVIILDEFGDLMLQAKKEIESRIIRLVQKARACGIHLILATQRPSVDCITGLIKSNLPTRIGFKVNSFDDSRCIFDIGGAEKLLGRGDLYFRSVENPDLTRIQGCFIDTPEVQKVTDFIKANNETYFDESVSDFINKVEEEPTETSSSDEGGMGDGGAKVDDTFIKALWFCVTSNQASVSMIQRRFPIGYMKACKIIDWMENMNYITQSEGSKPRKVLLSRDEFIQKYGEIDD